MLYGVVIATVLAVTVATCCDFMVSGAARGRTYDSIDNVPHRTTALLLGTGPVSRWGGPNRYYYTRIEAAAELYKSGKIDSIIVSGARRGDYDEPSMMIADLVARGVPDTRCVPDYEGHTTRHSVEHATRVFHADSVLLISQRFHNERALYMARDCGVDAIAYNAGNYYGSMPRIIYQWSRERISRIKAVAQTLL